MPAPSVVEDRLVFTLADSQRLFTRVGLDCDDAVEGGRRFRRTARGWSLSLPRPELKRLEYRLVVSKRGGNTEVVCDPDNAERVQTAFGERSVALLPGYEEPRWLRDGLADSRHVAELAYDDAELGELPITVWQPAELAAETPAPLLVVHDGPEYAELSDLTTYLMWLIARDEVPPFRAALMQPVDRDEWYAANPDYARAELSAVGHIGETVAVDGPLVVMGASLGGLAALTVAAASEGRVRGVVAQSGSFFDVALDPQESAYPYFDRVTAVVAGVRAAGAVSEGSGLSVGLTCGRLEENWPNNQALATALESQGHAVTLTGLDDLHNYTAWRDGFDPTLGSVLRSVWGQPWMGR